jgi:UDP-N-acetyl-alpha-D-muramoyl-L-alanyl-L-glutamate epimerase
MFTSKVRDLREKYPFFVYDGYLFEQKNNDLEMRFNFSAPPDLKFESVVFLKNIEESRLKEIKKEVLDNLVFHIGLSEMVSYWKAVCSPEIIIKAGYLNNKQLSWWHKQILAGMGEYFFENQINFTSPNFLSIKNEANSQYSHNIFKDNLDNKVIVPVGGGKDSLVTLGAIKKSHFRVNSLILNNNRQVEIANKSSEVAGFHKPIVIERFLDKNLIDLPKEKYLNGHTPFSLYLAFVSVLAAVIFNYKYIALSNETSANEESVVYLGRKINHQYSKSFEFEKDFNGYSGEYLAKEVKYFSFLRPLHEIQIVRLFAKHREFYKSFSSCNISLAKNNIGWCSSCSKCLFVFVMLYPFVSLGDIVEIFGINLLDQASFLSELESLVGMSDQKPFECVGTKEEVKIGLYLSWQKNKELGVEQPVLLNYFENEIMTKEQNWQQRANNLLNSWNSNNLLPPEFGEILKKEVQGV